MKPKDIITLKLIESLERDSKQTQRELSKEFNISLGLVNSFTKRMIRKGYFKIKNIPRNRIKYMLTLKGMYEKTRLTYRYILYSLVFYKDIRLKMSTIYSKLSMQGKKRIFLVGAGELMEIALISLDNSSINLAAIIDDEKIGQKIMGNVVEAHSKLEDASIDDIVMITKVDCDEHFQCLIQSFAPEGNLIDLSNPNDLMFDIWNKN